MGTVKKGYWSLIALAGGILLLTAIIYYKSLYFGFVNWDDPKYVYENETIRGLTLHHLKHFFSNFYVGMYQPLTMVSYAVDYIFWHLNPFGYHLQNLFWHLLNTLLVFCICFRLITKKMVAVYVSLIFALHPMHVESVAWISERKDVLFTFFYLFGMLVYLKFLEYGKKRMYFFTLFFFLLSLFCKSAAVTFPLILLLIDYYKGKKIATKKQIAEKLPLFVLSLIFGIIGVFSQKVFSVPLMDSWQYNAIDKVVTALYSCFYYLSQYFIPSGLSVMHPYPAKINGFLIPEFYIQAGVMLLIAIGIITLVFSKIPSVQFRRSLIFSLLFFLFTIILVLYLPVGSSVVAERYSYVPYFGIALLISEVVCQIRIKLVRIGISGLMALHFIVLLVLTFSRIDVWKSSIDLWNSVIETNPNYIGYYNRGNAWSEIHQYEKAESDYNKALSGRPDYYEALENRGISRTWLNKKQEALSDFNRAIQLKPDQATAYFNKANLLKLMNSFTLSLKNYNAAIARDATNPDYWIQRANLKKEMNDITGALADYSSYLQLKPDDFEVYNNCGVLHMLHGNYLLAREAYDNSIELNPLYAEAYSNRAILRGEMNDFTGALQDDNYATSLSPQKAKLFFNRGIHYYKLQRFVEAISDFNQAMVLQPDYPEALANRAAAKFNQKDFSGAVNDYSLLIKAFPDDGSFYHNRAVVWQKMNRKSEACTDLNRAVALGHTESMLMLNKYCK